MSINVSELVVEPGVYAITGGAGAGKSSMAWNAAGSIAGADGCVIPLDCFFIGDSDYRKKLIRDKESSSWDVYRDSCNQMNWWDWGTIEKELEKHNKRKERIFIEGALLGPEFMWCHYDKIIYINTSSQERLSRLVKRDGNKRTGLEIAHRFLITEYSERLHYEALLPYAKKTKKLIICNTVGELQASYKVPKHSYLPKEV